MSICVYLKHQDHSTEEHSHECSRQLAETVLMALVAHPIGTRAIKLATDEPWASIKRRFRMGFDGGHLKAFGRPEGLLLSYPHKDQTSFRYQSVSV